MGARWLVLLAAAACSSARGADLEISVPVQADEVDVFVAPYQCSDCPGAVGWDNSMGPRGADGVFKLDIDQVTVAQPLGNGHYRVVLVGKDANPVARIVVVAFQQGVAKAAVRLDNVVLPIHRAETWDLKLDPNVVDVPPGDPQPASDGWRLRAWSNPAVPQPGASRCVVSERISNGTVEREFYLRPDDTDCDGVVHECDYYYYLDPGSSTIDAANCIQPFSWPATSTTPICMIGGMGCSETMANPLGCVRVEPAYCAAAELCSATCNTQLPMCVHNQGVSAIHCTAYAPALDTTCAPYTATVSFDSLLGNTMETCDELLFADESQAQPSYKFDTQWQASGGVNGGITVTAAPSGNGTPCSFDLTMVAGTPVSFKSSYLGLADVRLSNGRHDVMPIEIQTSVVAACPAGISAMECSFTPTSTETMQKCAIAP
jgi:hypothetical protein